MILHYISYCYIRQFGSISITASIYKASVVEKNTPEKCRLE